MNPYRHLLTAKRPCERRCGRKQVVELVNDEVAIYLCESCADLTEKEYEDRGPWERVWIFNADES